MIRKYKSRDEFLIKELNFSNREINELNKFIMDHKTKYIKEFLNELVEDSSITDREKVAISYIVGRFMKDPLLDIKMTALHNSILEEIVFANEKEDGE